MFVPFFWLERNLHGIKTERLRISLHAGCSLLQVQAPSAMGWVTAVSNAGSDTPPIRTIHGTNRATPSLESVWGQTPRGSSPATYRRTVPKYILWEVALGEFPQVFPKGARRQRHCFLWMLQSLSCDHLQADEVEPFINVLRHDSWMLLTLQHRRMCTHHYSVIYYEGKQLCSLQKDSYSLLYNSPQHPCLLPRSVLIPMPSLSARTMESAGSSYGLQALCHLVLPVHPSKWQKKGTEAIAIKAENVALLAPGLSSPGKAELLAKGRKRSWVDAVFGEQHCRPQCMKSNEAK